MQSRLKAAAFCLFVCASVSASEAPFTGAFIGGGRGCYGGLYVRTKTVEWNTPFNRCKRTPYTLLDSSVTPGQERLAMKLKNPSCSFHIIALEHTDEFGWTAYGYQSQEAYEKREQLGWKDSAMESRLVLTCSVDRLPR